MAFASSSFSVTPAAFFHVAGPLTLYPVTKSAAAEELEKRISSVVTKSFTLLEARCFLRRVVGTATLENHILYFRGSLTGSYLTIEPKIGASVPVAVWEVTPSDEKALDRYEGYPNFYYKQDYTLQVTSMDKTNETTLDCFAYVMRSDRPIGIPSDYYVYTCLEGYEYFGFDKRILINTVNRMRRILCRRMK